MEDTAASNQVRHTIPLRSAPPINPLSSASKILPIVIIVLIAGSGIFTGLVLSSRHKNQQQATTSLADEENLTPEVKESFAKTFKDEAEGTIEKNDDLDKYAQGQWKLIRPGGDTQTVFLTSSVMDLDEYVGKKVKVFGETFSSSDVGWLMDVGKVKEVQ